MNTSNFTGLEAVQGQLLVSTIGTFTDNDVSVASDTIRIANHGLVTGDVMALTTTGALPSGLAVNTAYYTILVDASTFKLATSSANAFAGTAIDITALNGGTHTATKNAMGVVLTNVFVPSGGIIEKVTGDKVVTMTSGGAATLAIDCGSQSIKAATAYNDASFTGTTLHGSFGTAPVKLTANSQLKFTIAAAALTAGDYRVFIEFVQSV